MLCNVYKVVSRQIGALPPRSSYINARPQLSFLNCHLCALPPPPLAQSPYRFPCLFLTHALLICYSLSFQLFLYFCLSRSHSFSISAYLTHPLPDGLFINRPPYVCLSPTLHLFSMSCLLFSSCRIFKTSILNSFVYPYPPLIVTFSISSYVYFSVSPLPSSSVSVRTCPEIEFLDEIQSKVLTVFLLVINGGQSYFVC